MRNAVVLYLCQVRRVHRHGREVLSSRIVRLVLVLVDVGYLMVPGSWRGPGRSTGWDFNNESLLDALSAGIVCIEGGCNGFFGPQNPLRRDNPIALFAAHDL